MVPAEAGGGPVSGFRRPGRPLRGEPVPAPFPGAAVHGGQAVSAEKDGPTWRFGTEADVAWIEAGISIGFEITSAIPPVFDSYATIIVPEKRRAEGRICIAYCKSFVRSHQSSRGGSAISTPVQTMWCSAMPAWWS
jgi:hypothetical protein